MKSYDNIAKVGENFKSLSTNDAPKILLEKLKYLQKEYNERPSSRKNMKSRIEDTKKEYIDSMHGSINVSTIFFSFFYFILQLKTRAKNI